jgi:putative addiction module killer protein
MIEKTNYFNKWLNGLKDISAKFKILAKLKRIELGNLGDHKSIGNGFGEFRFDIGPGYRVYYHKKGDQIILLINGGDKKSQSRDIEIAKKIWKELEMQDEN